ncbi:unnamed protein product [Chironomus riparius]|uniref:Uncharacterized protein n=1 Tax=Chironomus riparius TaxID=315576 RepID=A0A9N9RYV2_9DIPT|nr:unnamed protein product [Chironomus riparius]
MTDLIKGLLSQMSSKFNEQTNPELVKKLDFHDDKTLKWKTLINNTYAKKDREKRNKNRNKDGEDLTDDKSSIQQQEPSTSTSSLINTDISLNSSDSDNKIIDSESMDNAEETKSNQSISEKFGNNVKEKKIVIDDDLHTPEQKSNAAAQQAASTHTLKGDDDEKNIISTNLPQLNTNSQAIESSNTKVTQTTVTTTALTADKKHDDNTVIMSSKINENVSSIGVALSDDDKKAVSSTSTAGKTSKVPATITNNSNTCNKIIDKTISSSRNLRSNRNSTIQQNILQNSSTTPTQRQMSNSSSTMSDDKNKSDEIAVKSDLDENEITNNEDSSNATTDTTPSVVKKGRGRPRLEINKNLYNNNTNVTNNVVALKSSNDGSGSAAEGNENELDINQKRGRGRMPKTRSINESVSEEKKCETPTEDVDVKKEMEIEELPKRRGRSRKLVEGKDATADSSVKDEKEIDIIQSNDDETSKSQDHMDASKRKRGRLMKKPNEIDLPVEDKTDIKPSTSATNTPESPDDAKPRLLMTIRTDKSAVPKIIALNANTNGNSSENSTTNVVPENNVTEDQEKVIKKRGRRPKVITGKQTQAKKTTRSAKDESDGNISTEQQIPSPRKVDPVLLAPPIGRMRSQRRIKPTAKILENEELRQGFEVTNCKRLSLSNENLIDSFMIERSPPAASRSGHDSSTTRSPNVSSPNHTSHDNNQENSPILNKMNFPNKKACRDPQEFLNEIKSFKIGTNRSPEDNKKLTKSQHRRLIKQKEKHLGLLGLRPKNDYSSSSNESDSEEFNPHNTSSSKRPTITLRLRNQHKSSMGISPADHKRNVNLRKRENDRDILQSEKRMKMASVTSSAKEMETSDDDDCFVVESNSKTQNEGKENNHINLVCSCHQKTKYYIKQGQHVSLSVNGKIFCCAIDEIEKRKIGCTNELTDSLICLYRPSVKVSYMALCSSHKKRFAAHNCCSGCGLFCTQGTFVICSNKHFFHRNCATKYILNTPYEPNNPNYTGPTLLLKCPHCGIDAPDYDYRVTMRCENLPVFIQHRSNVPKPAKMGTMLRHPQNNHVIQLNSLILNIDKLIPDTVMQILKTAYDRLKLQHGTSDLSKLFAPKDVFHAIYRKDGEERISEIIASGFNLMTPLKDFHNGTCLHLISNFGTLTMAYLILSRANSHDFVNMMDKEMRTPIMYSVAGKKHDILKLLCQCGADVTIKGPDGMTVLHLAAKSGNLGATQIILENYRQIATISKLQKFINTTDDGHWTPLVWAAENGHGEIVNYLISLGADPNICDSENNTVLHWASLAGKLESIYPLMTNSDLNIQNIHGDTALHISARQSKPRICMLLMAHGANLNIRNLANETPLDVADEKGECAKLLRFNMDLRTIGIGGFKSNIGDKLILCNDISNGREIYPIQISRNLQHSDETILPDFKYITKNILLQNSIQIDQRISQMRICACSDNCISENCQCAQISLQNWYNIDGRLIANFNYTDPPMLFECNDVCGCNKLLCKNRVVQNGIKLPLTVFECDDKVKGFGVKCLTRIRKGSFVAQYLGEILTDQEADRRTDDSYFFDLGASDHCIDANFYGNVSRFFNHSCSPNIVPVRVYFEHQDLRFPKIALFASKDIEPGEEIAFDYGEKFWMIKYKYFKCLCKSDKCHYSADMIDKTVAEYHKRHGGGVSN